jgi:hypothetical protein
VIEDHPYPLMETEMYDNKDAARKTPAGKPGTVGYFRRNIKR